MTVRRNAVVPVATEPELPSGIHRCHRCGVGLAKWPRQYVCSWCKGDPAHGHDNYFNDMIDDIMARVAPPKMTRAQVRDMLLAERER